MKDEMKTNPSYDLISRADAIGAIASAEPKDSEYHYYKHIAIKILSELPSTELPKGELISRADAKQQISEWATIITNPTLLDKDATMVVLDSLPSAEVEPIVIKCKDCKNRAKHVVCHFLGEDGFCPYGERKGDEDE